MAAQGDIPTENSATESTPRAWPAGWSVRLVDSTGSTNEDLLRAAERGEIGDRAALMAGFQTAGRGRLDRRWDAPSGANLLASMYLVDVPDVSAQVMHRVGLAIVLAVDEALGDRPSQVPAAGLKWPNDVLLGGRKLAGVLAQRSTSAPGVVVGFGVNVGWAPEGAACLADLAPVQPATLLAMVLEAFDGLAGDVTALYRDRLDTLGKAVRVELPGGRMRYGRAVDVDELGRLVVRDGGGTEHSFDVGDIVHLRRDQ